MVCNTGKRPLVVSCHFKSNVPQINKKSHFYAMNAKRGLLRNMIKQSKAPRHVSKREKERKKNEADEILLPNVLTMPMMVPAKFGERST